MLTHIVIWKYRDDVEQFAREEHVNLLRRLRTIIPEVQSLSVGIDTLFLPRSYDTGLVAIFADRAAVLWRRPKHRGRLADGILTQLGLTPALGFKNMPEHYGAWVVADLASREG